jgi:hypothetical protein
VEAPFLPFDDDFPMEQPPARSVSIGYGFEKKDWLRRPRGVGHLVDG